LDCLFLPLTKARLYFRKAPSSFSPAEGALISNAEREPDLLFVGALTKGADFARRVLTLLAGSDEYACGEHKF